jgi:dTDP-4-amino-4,6-dideoxygalactose transaminase
MGPETRAFEAELEAFLGGGRGVACVNTGTSALHLAVAALGIGPGDEVIVPSLTFVASFQAVAVTGARPVACDIDEASALVDLADARRRLTPRTRAIMPVHYAGYPGDIGAVRDFGRANGLRVIEDAAHAFGTRHGGCRVGADGDVVCFSFDPIKNITAGQGGAVVSADASFLERARRMRNLALERGPTGEIGDAIEVRDLGWRYQMPDLMAALGRVQLARLATEFAPARMALAARYRERLRGLAGVKLLESGPEVVPHIFPIRVTGGRRDALRAALREAGYESLVHYKPAHLLEQFRATGCPVAERLYGELLTLPLHCELTPADVDGVSDAIGRFLGEG